MVDDKLSAFLISKGIKFSESEKMSDHTSFKIGGPAECYVEPCSAEEITEIIKYSKFNNKGYFVIGNGTNLLVKDSGIDGIVIHLGKSFSEIKLIDKETIFCESGTALSQLCLFARDHSLSGMEFAYGIPGSVGGSIYMNAGAYGGEMKDILKSASYIDEKGEMGSVDVEKMGMGYRKSFFTDSHYVITGGTFKLKKGNKEEINHQMVEILEKRKSKQPLDYPSAGSTFKRPEGAYASALIDECGLKGKNIGDAYVSEKHAGFIINKGNASFDDVMNLVDYVKKDVLSKTGYKLEMEVKVVGK